MNKISPTAIAIAFVAEFVADIVLQTLLFAIYAGGAIQESMTQEELKAAVDALSNTPAFLLIQIVRGTATTIAGGYLAARLAGSFPYYNGLGIGVVGVVFSLFFLGKSPLWFEAYGILMSVPASIYGAHLAKKHMAAAGPP